MEYTTLLFDLSDDGVGTITLNRPEAMNSFTLTMLHEFDHLWAHIRDNDDVRAVVLRGSAGRAFSTGADVKSHATEPVGHANNLWNARDPGESLGARSNKVWKPVVTAVHGLCCAGAFYWLNESDVIICSQDAQFFDPHVSYGLVCAVEPIGMSYRLPLGEVLRMSLLGNDERIGADTALRIGLVSEITSNEALWDRAHELAAKIAAKPPAAVQGTVRAIWESLDVPRTTALTQSLKYTMIGNPVAQAQMDVEAARKQPRSFEVR